MKGWHFGKHYPSDFNRLFGHFMHSRIVEHYVRTSDDLSVLEFSAVVFRYEGVRLATENPQLIIIQLTAGPYFLRYLKS